ncbi:hypothetical protein TKK_0015821 [Trichogramma kaykai]
MKPWLIGPNIFLSVAKWKKDDTVGPMSRALRNNDIGISGSPIIMNVRRLKMAKYIYPSWPFRTRFMFRSSQPQNIKFNQILRPFTINVWHMIGTVTIFCTVVLCISLMNENCDKIITLYFNSYLITIGVLCQQETDFEMKRISTRIAVLFMWIFSILIYNRIFQLKEIASGAEKIGKNWTESSFRTLNLLRFFHKR